MSAEKRRGAIVDEALKKAVKDALSESNSRPVRERYTSSLSVATASSFFYGLRWTKNFAGDFAFVTQIMAGITFMGAAGFPWYFVGDTTSFYLLAKGGVVDDDEFYFDFGLGYEWTVDHFVMQIEIGGMGWDGEIELWLGGLSLGGRW